MKFLLATIGFHSECAYIRGGAKVSSSWPQCERHPKQSDDNPPSPQNPNNGCFVKSAAERYQNRIACSGLITTQLLLDDIYPCYVFTNGKSLDGELSLQPRRRKNQYPRSISYVYRQLMSSFVLRTLCKLDPL